MSKRGRRQGQKRSDGHVSTPKEACPKCKEYLVTAWKTKNRKFVRVGLVCPSDTCEYVIKDPIEVTEFKEDVQP